MHNFVNFQHCLSIFSLPMLNFHPKKGYCVVENALEGNGNYFTVMFFAEHLTYFVIVCKIILTPPVFQGKRERRKRGEERQCRDTYHEIMKLFTFSVPPAHFSAKLIALALAGTSVLRGLRSKARE